jgi:hypothetical protein
MDRKNWAMPPNVLRISRRRGALHEMPSKTARSRAPKAVGLHAILLE